MTSTFMEWIRGLSLSDANVRGAVAALLASLVLIVVLALLARAFRRLRERYQARIERREITLRVQRWEMVSAERIQRTVKIALGLFHVIAAVVLIDIYVTLVLRLFPATEALSDRYFEFVAAPVIALWRAFVGYLPNALEIVVITALTLFFLKFLHIAVHALESGAVKIPGFYPDWADPTYKLVRALVFAFLLIRIFPLLPGADEQAFKAVSLFVGALLTLGSTAAVGNAIAGVVLVYTRSFQIGDWIRVGKTEGEVVRRTLLVTRLRTTGNEQVTIPNGEVLRDHVVNFTPAATQGRLGLTTTVTISYDVDWRTVDELLVTAAKATPKISSDPPPVVLQTSLDDHAVGYTLRAFTSGPPPLGGIRAALRQNILDAFHRAGVEIVSPGFSVIRRDEEPAMPPQSDAESTAEPTRNSQPSED
jgi:small-conductance mechanosensitive channel